MARTFGQPVALEKPQAPKPARAPSCGAAAPIPAPAPQPFRPGRPAGRRRCCRCSGSGSAPPSSGAIWGRRAWPRLTRPRKALIAAAVLLPPFLFLAIAAALARSAAMSDATRVLLVASERLFAADETAANNAARLARAVRRELDGLNTGLDVAFQRMRTMEAVLEKQISTLDDAGARAQVRGDTIAARLNQESARIETLGDSLNEAAGRAGETRGGPRRPAQGHHGIGRRHA